MMFPRKWWNGLRVVFGFALMFFVCSSSIVEAFAATETPNIPGLTDQVELETFLDSIITAQLNDMHIAGAAVAIVKDGEVFFSKGYGYADVEKQTPVNPDTTVFLVGSAAKLFTWTAVMQLVEQDRLDLEADINQYLDFQIPATFPEPITLEHLMTHTPGFENTPFGLGTTSPEELISNGVWLANNIPVRRWPPGHVTAYSNYGTGLAGYIVERVSGMPYETYIEQHILSPLDMAHTTLRQPVPPELSADQARGYNYINGSFQPQGTEYIHVVPAGGLQASATDMARFMIAHLQNGRYCQSDCKGGDVRILGESTAEQMHSRLWTADERLNGMDHGFYELSQNGYRVLGHSGDTSLFHSILALLPEQNVGLFVSYNSMSSSGVPHTLLEAFMDHYYPVASEQQSKPLPDSAARTDLFTGTYQMVRLQYSGGGKILGLLYLFPVQASSNGELIANSPITGSKRFTEVTPLYFEEVNGDGRLKFQEDEAGNITFLYFNDLPQIALRKAAWYETRQFNLSLLGVTTLLFLSVLIVGLVRLATSLFRRQKKVPQSGLSRLAPVAFVMMALVGLTLEIGLFFAITDSWAIASGQRSLLTLIGGLSIIAVLLAPSTLVFAVFAWRENWWRAITRIHYTLVALASIALIWFLAFWNQIGWQWW